MASLRSLCSEYNHIHLHSDDGIRGQERYIQPFN